jgi:hypothetical protein
MTKRLESRAPIVEEPLNIFQDLALFLCHKKNSVKADQLHGRYRSEEIAKEMNSLPRIPEIPQVADDAVVAFVH